MVAAPEAGPGRLANGDSMHKVRVVVSMGCVNFEGAVKPGPASQRNFDLRWHCRPSSRDHSSQSLHIYTGSIESTRWAAEVGGRRPSRAKADAGNSTTHNCWLAYHRSCSPPRADCASNRSTRRENLPKKVILPLTPPCRPSPAQTKLLSRSRP